MKKGHESKRVKPIRLQLLQSKIDTYRYWTFIAGAMLDLIVATGAVCICLQLLLLLLLLEEFILSLGGTLALSFAIDLLCILVSRPSVVYKSALCYALVVTGRYLTANRVCLCIYQCLPLHF